MKALIIANPYAHSGNGPLQAAWRREDYRRRIKNLPDVERVEWADTEYPGHAAWLAQEAAENDYTYVLAAGGDGTVNEVLNGLMRAAVSPKARPVMGVLPCGTCNDFYRALEQAERFHEHGRGEKVHFPVDVGRVVFDDVVRFFCLSVGIGLLSWANQQYLECSRLFGRRLSHIPAGLRTLWTYKRSTNVRIICDATVVAKKVLSIAINNVAAVAGGKALAPGASINDACFDVLTIAPTSLPRLLWLAVKIVLGRHTKADGVQLTKTRDITIQSDKPFAIHLDGELVPELHSKARFLHVTVMPSEIRIIYPSVLAEGNLIGKRQMSKHYRANQPSQAA
jgi:diacylglycerol kinase (ATP)